MNNTSNLEVYGQPYQKTTSGSTPDSQNLESEGTVQHKINKSGQLKIEKKINFFFTLIDFTKHPEKD